MASPGVVYNRTPTPRPKTFLSGRGAGSTLVGPLEEFVGALERPRRIRRMNQAAGEPIRTR